MKKYSIFGAGASGLYTIWRLLNGETTTEKGKLKQLHEGDVVELYDWGQYDFNDEHRGTRAAGARICTWHFNNDPEASYLELGGMRYSQWNETTQSGHKVVSKVIELLNLDQYSVEFDESADPLYYLRHKNMYSSEISASNPAPYNIPNGGAAQTPFYGMNEVGKLAITQDYPKTRLDWLEFNKYGRLKYDTDTNSVFKNGDLVRNIGYWNIMYDQLTNEGYDYAADGNGYSSNVINWNSSVAFEANDEFMPGTEYKTLTHGFSMMFNALFNSIVQLARDKGIDFRYTPNTRLHSILADETTNKVRFKIASRESPWLSNAVEETDAAWLAMPRHSIELVAQATRYHHAPKGTYDVLNQASVQNYLEAAIVQPSYKVGLFFDCEWWMNAKYKPRLEQQGKPNSIGPSVTDTPIRMVVYFGNNALDKTQKPIYGILASYDDEMFTDFWKELELNTDEDRTIPSIDNIQPLQGPKKCPNNMITMLRKQLAEIHFGPGSDYTLVPEPLEARYMDWSLPPFNAGYHAWAAHYDINDVQRKIRKPSQLVNKDLNIYIVGEAYSNDQAWVEGAYCTAESVLNDFFDVHPIVDDTQYPFISPEL
ncbi:hypothetical protein [Runella sp. SP2]|uniref:hypothetical protein n=1 Tax=Runella sp. SP2 TaxID=2268026 RepID=UPI000F08D5BD|nr:hypothetical protein [Runella sp. SP2]AYQ31260.1 hypothetical protein DTQ70_03290 [Runella sp. SP2]